jgi:hypothetical protein
MDFDAVFVIDRVIQERGFYVYKMHNIAAKHSIAPARYSITKALPAGCPYTYLEILTYPTDFDVVTVIGYRWGGKILE